MIAPSSSAVGIARAALPFLPHLLLSFGYDTLFCNAFFGRLLLSPPKKRFPKDDDDEHEHEHDDDRARAELRMMTTTTFVARVLRTKSIL
jgi:hypothetical protein